ncbi:hypothetical protein F4779DRAFT_579225 [Xylariaceae sp. FL0662B]|nr:hypothetical protein F4779DRAFT_579225 [Xylariaceae sp. FL0662B]
MKPGMIIRRTPDAAARGRGPDIYLEHQDARAQQASAGIFKIRTRRFDRRCSRDCFEGNSSYHKFLGCEVDDAGVTGMNILDFVLPVSYMYNTRKRPENV